MPVGGIEPWRRRPHGTPTTPFSCRGSPCTDSLDCHHKPPPGVPPTIWRGVLERFKSANTRALRTRCGIEFCGPLARSGVSGVFTSTATRADTHTSHRYGVSLSRYHQHRSTMIRPCDPPQRASLSQPLSNRCPILHHQHTPHQQPPPDKHCCCDPMTPPCRAPSISHLHAAHSPRT